MRSIGAAEMALDAMLQRVTDPNRKTFGKFLYEHGKLALLIPPHDPWYVIVIILQALSLQTLRIHAPRSNLHVSSSSALPCRQVD
jgi:hypothetical protein